MTIIRVLISLFMGLLVVISIMGWVWTGAHQPLAQSVASRLVLGVSACAGILGLVAVWISPRHTSR
jgi:hypothetical protein